MDPVTGIKYSKACDQLGTIREFMGYYLRTFCNLKLSRNVLISSFCYFYHWGGGNDILFSLDFLNTFSWNNNFSNSNILKCFNQLILHVQSFSISSLASLNNLSAFATGPGEVASAVQVPKKDLDLDLRSMIYRLHYRSFFT